MIPASTLAALGRIIEQARKDRGVTQTGLGEALQKARPEPKLTEKAWQSLITRLEKGKVADPDPVLLRLISENLCVPYTTLVGALVTDKYSLNEQAVSPLARQPITLGELAKWEADQTELWIVTPEFKDELTKSFCEAVAKCLRKKNGRVFFFLPDAKRTDFERYKSMQLSLTDKMASAGLHMIGLDDNLMALTGPCYALGTKVATDRDGIPTDGYFILWNYKEPEVAFQMSAAEIQLRIPVLVYYVNKLMDGQLTSPESQQPKASRGRATDQYNQSRIRG